jgi:hypothetical protein
MTFIHSFVGSTCVSSINRNGQRRRDGHDHGSHDGWGWDAYIEHEKHKLKYEILKLKAKKKIAVLQNKVELKKLLSMLLQKKIQALEWWR